MDNNLISVVIMFLIGVAIFLAGWFARRLVDRSKIVSAEELAEKIVREAQREGATQKKAAVLEAKDERYKAKAKCEEDTQSSRAEDDKLQAMYRNREYVVPKAPNRNAIDALVLQMVEQFHGFAG